MNYETRLAEIDFARKLGVSKAILLPKVLQKLIINELFPDLVEELKVENLMG
jgi:hypothetical protein